MRWRDRRALAIGCRKTSKIFSPKKLFSVALALILTSVAFGSITHNSSGYLPPENNPPTTPTDLTFSPDPVYVGNDLVATASGSTDADGDPITYYYRFVNANDSVVRQDYSPDNSYVIQVVDAHDILVVSAIAYDGKDFSKGEYWEIINISNSPPTTPTDLTFSPDPVYVGNNLVATASGSTDADDDPITYYYKFYNVNDSVIRQDYSTDNSYVIQVGDAHDTIRIYTKAYDDIDYSGEYYEDMAISDTPPTAPTSIALSPTPVKVGDNLVATASGSTDADGDPITYYYKFYNVNDSLTKQDYGTDSSYVIADNDAQDTIRVFAKARAYGAYSGEYYVDIEVSGVPPTAPTSIALSPTPVKVGDNLVATASGSTDADGDPITYYYKFYNVNDSLTKQDYGTDSSYVIQKADAHDTIRVYTKAYDGSAYSGEYYTDTAISNSAPTPSFGADKTITNNVIEINTSESIAFTDSSSDADGDSPLSYSWAFGDGGTSTEQNPTYRYWIAGNFTVNLTVTDSYGDSNYNNTITVKVKEKIVCNNIYNPSTGRAGRNFISWGRRSAKRADKVAKLLGLNPKDLIGRYNTTTGTYETYLVDELLEADWYVQPYDVLKVEILNSSTGPITVTLDPHDSVNPKRSIRLKNTYNKTTKSGNPGYNYITYSNLTTTTASAFAQYMGIPRGWVLSKRSGNRWQGYIVDISPSSYDFTIYPNDILCAKVPPSLNDTTKDVGSDM